MTDVLSERHRVVIIGSGFAGLAAAKALRRADAEVTVVDRTNHHLFQPLLYQVAPGSSPKATSPFRHATCSASRATLVS